MLKNQPILQREDKAERKLRLAEQMQNCLLEHESVIERMQFILAEIRNDDELSMSEMPTFIGHAFSMLVYGSVIIATARKQKMSVEFMQEVADIGFANLYLGWLDAQAEIVKDDEWPEGFDELTVN